MHLRECINPLAPNDHCTGRYFVSVFCVGILALALVQCSRLVGLTAVVGFLAPTAHCHCNQSSDYVLEWWKLVRVTMA